MTSRENLLQIIVGVEWEGSRDVDSLFPRLVLVVGVFVPAVFGTM